MAECWRMTRIWPSREDRDGKWVKTVTRQILPHQTFLMEREAQSREAWPDLGIPEGASRGEAEAEPGDRAWDRVPGIGGREGCFFRRRRTLVGLLGLKRCD